ncbi:MAG TPA: DUF4157 domain-containing protein [Chitinophagaceae bacterium]|nr:DUF4157 domain-containing protein [Chitinophagaceae bacterium]
MSYSRRSYRQRNPKREEQPQPTSFFMHANKGTVQTKKDMPFFQAKLTVGEAGDQYEQEADAVANQVVNHSQGSANAKPVQRKKINKVQKLSSDMEDEKAGTNDERMRRDKEVQAKPDEEMKDAEQQQEEEGVQMKTQEEEKEETKDGAMMQRKPEAGSSHAASGGLSARIEQSAGKGKPLPKKLLSDMHSSFGEDFSDVNVHTDDHSAEMNKDLGAQAFTHGKDIFFNKGKFNPDSTEGKRLLAHELTHVVQQSSSNESKSAE